VPGGVAPNVKVSLVLLPEECASLVPRRWRYYAKEMKLRAMSKAFALKFYRDRDKAMGRSAAA